MQSFCQEDNVSLNQYNCPSLKNENFAGLYGLEYSHIFMSMMIFDFHFLNLSGQQKL